VCQSEDFEDSCQSLMKVNRKLSSIGLLSMDLPVDVHVYIVSYTGCSKKTDT